VERETLRDEDIQSEVREGSAWARAEVEDTDSTDTGTDADVDDKDADADDTDPDADTTDPS
jgi:hypothetical protein